MIRTRWYKVFSDLWGNRGRTLVVALAIAVGVYAVGVIIDWQGYTAAFGSLGVAIGLGLVVYVVWERALARPGSVAADEIKSVQAELKPYKIVFQGNQVVSGLALTILGTGLADTPVSIAPAGEDTAG